MIREAFTLIDKDGFHRQLVVEMFTDPEGDARWPRRSTVLCQGRCQPVQTSWDAPRNASQPSAV